jgi:hypothetical protein
VRIAIMYTMSCSLLHSSSQVSANTPKTNFQHSKERHFRTATLFFPRSPSPSTMVSCRPSLLMRNTCHRRHPLLARNLCGLVTSSSLIDCLIVAQELHLPLPRNQDYSMLLLKL